MRSRSARAFMLLVFVALAAGRADGAEAALPEAPCGTKTLYGKRLGIHVVGTGLSCAQARRIVWGSCREGRVWSCFSFKPPAPVLVWFRESRRFARSLLPIVEAHRPPCRQAAVTRLAWRRALGQRRLSAFPSRLQVLADDLVRCGQLDGERYAAVRALLGRPDTTEIVRGRRVADWELGLERDSFFQVDNEFLSLRFDRLDRLRSLEFVQG